ncbi:MAG: deaminase [Candidatus Micrarchaeota archaeon]
MSSLIIGLTGENCGGKGTVAEYLVKKGFVFASLSDVIRAELVSEGKEVTRENLTRKANEMRQEFGPSVLAKKTLAALHGDRNYIIDSIRNPAEVEELKKSGNFFLFYITAPAELRFERMRSRSREGDLKTLQAFLKQEDLERQGPAHQQNLAPTAKMADKTLVNDGNLQQFYDKIDAALAEISKDFKLVRPAWDDYFMNIAKVVASRSNCVKRKVAAIVVKDRRIVSTGYNGTPRGVRNCYEGGCARCNSFGGAGENLGECVCSHGEENAIIQAAFHGFSVKGATLYSTFSPCLFCTKLIINSGIAEVIYNTDYPMTDFCVALLNEAGVKTRKYKLQ